MARNDDNGGPKLALLIDGDNLRASLLPVIMREASALGTVTIRRVYGHFGSAAMNPWQQLIHDFAITPVHIPPATRGKNATDMKLAIEAIDLLHTRDLDGFCIASSDSDFTTLASRIREEGIPVYGFGEQKTAKPYVNACDRFFYCDLLAEAGDVEVEKKAGAAKPKRPGLPQSELFSAVDDASGDDGWARLGVVGQILNKRMPDFDPRNYGYAKLSELVEAARGLETRREEGGRHVMVRRKPAAKSRGGRGRGRKKAES
jgi:hypothetical protein